MPASLRSALALSLFVLSGLGLCAQVTIGTTTVATSGAGDSVGDEGETFIAPTAATSLSSLTVVLGGSTTPQIVDAYIYAWNGSTTASGTLGALVGSAAITTSANLVTEYTFDFSTAPVIAGSNYAFVLYDGSGNQGLAWQSETYSSGRIIYAEVGGAPATGNAYSANAIDNLNFSATFATTPVPETKTLLWGGVILCAGLAFWQSRRRLAASAS